MTARPLEVERKLLDQQARIRGGPGAAIERLPLTVVLDNVRSLWNVGSMFRTADACGVQQMFLTGVTGCPPRPELTKTALGAEQAVAWSYLADPVEAVRRLVAEGFEPIALETTPRGIPLDRFEWPHRVALVVGNEVAGVGAAVLDECDRHLSLPMLGVKDSLNVAVAFGIAAYAAARSLRGSHEEAR
ncbi:MAG: TrmH family RNA methyltransferase [Acidobacteria bacterium]|nr:TrmH family RNA methyltransferase [Acidobacteriota bacterium]NIM61375.1 TrmH family RNA methyltransferase [Acidobacteriota bacterium]NIO58810.1 TrmH family RNA methyltransferase [Acidobacteriota bacterium]NIQ29854.1 TrmH family RNA methyltransferase [Acidobacteriota bacterium]NIQ84587.1 TrmH family RNA methyltransferase [Acidobacteriota bacterium]